MTETKVVTPKSVISTTEEGAVKKLSEMTPPPTVITEQATITTTTQTSLPKGWAGFITFFVTFLLVMFFSALCLYLSSPALIRSSEDPTVILQEKLFGWAALFGLIVAILFTVLVVAWRPSAKVVITKN